MDCHAVDNPKQMSLHATNPEAVQALRDCLALVVHNGRRPSFLIVDDNPIERELSGWAVEKLGGVPMEVNTAKDALDAMKLTRIDVVMMDLKLPQGDGAYLYRELVKIKPNVPIIVVTGMDLESPWVKRVVESGAQILFVKPIQASELAELTGLAINE